MSPAKKKTSHDSSFNKEISYLPGFGNHFVSEAIAGALPQGQNSPQHVPYGLYAEQISGTSFLAPRHSNLFTWFYRIRPSILHHSFTKIDKNNIASRPFDSTNIPPNPMRWDPLTIPKKPTDFVEGLITFAGNGSPSSVRGCAVHLYAANKSMTNRFFYNADGEMLIAPQQGSLSVRTECGALEIKPGEIIVIPRGIKFQVKISDNLVRGYICENYGPHFRLPELGPIGANGLAHRKDFLYPVAAYEDKEDAFELVAKFEGNLWQTQLTHSPLDVVAWHGTYAPYKYDLNLFQTINTVSFDHCDPSIFTVLTSPSEMPGTANVDFVIFPSRWSVAEHTFRPPYFHRNIMSEFMGLIKGVYSAKEEGFLPGGASLHNCMTAHGPDSSSYEQAIKAKLEPDYVDHTLAIMFESSLVFCPTEFALKSPLLQKDYLQCWQSLKSNFKNPG